MNDETFSARFESEYRNMYSASPEKFTALDYVGALGSIREALLYSRLFLPEFIEVDGMVFLQDIFEDAGGQDAIRKLHGRYGDKRKVEESLNSFDLKLNLPNQLGKNAPDDDRMLAEQLAVAWRLRLQQLYRTGYSS